MIPVSSLAIAIIGAAVAGLAMLVILPIGAALASPAILSIGMWTFFGAALVSIASPIIGKE